VYALAGGLCAEGRPTVATTVVSDLAVRRMEQKMTALDDETLLFVMLGLLAEMPEEWQPTTPMKRMTARVAFEEICRRWVPLDIFNAAINALMSEAEADDA
jgi:hypothetical protein